MLIFVKINYVDVGRRLEMLPFYGSSSGGELLAGIKWVGVEWILPLDTARLIGTLNHLRPHPPLITPILSLALTAALGGPVAQADVFVLKVV